MDVVLDIGEITFSKVSLSVFCLIPQYILKPVYLGCAIHSNEIPNIQSLLAPHVQISKQVAHF